MRTNIVICRFGYITIKTEDLEAFWKIIFDKPKIESNTPTLADLFAVLVTSSFDMIDG